jgi:general secretion pathway protein M
MIGAIASWWSGLSTRERWLVGVAGALAGIVIGWFLILSPLLNAIDDAREAHRAATDRHAAIMAQAALLRAPAALRPANASAATLDLVIAQSAAERGFTLDRNDAAGGGRTTIAMASANAPALLAWLSGLEAAGIKVADVTMRPNGNGTVTMTATLAR